MVRLYWTTTLSNLVFSFEPSFGIASKPRSSNTISVIVSSSSSEGSHGLSAKSGMQRLLIFRATCCYALNEASPIKSDEALYIFLSVSLISLLCASISFGCSSTNGNRCKYYWSHSILGTLPSLWPLKDRVSAFFFIEANLFLSA